MMAASLLNKKILKFIPFYQRIGLLRCVGQQHSISTAAHPLFFRYTPSLAAEPLKKKKKADVTLIQEREKKKKVKLEKTIAKIKDKGRRLKPIEEIRGYDSIRKTLDQRIRQIPELTKEEFIAKSDEKEEFMKASWEYHWEANVKESRAISACFASQKKALQALREESEELYQLAVQPDPNLIPWKAKGPSYTPSFTGYAPPVGEIHDVTDKFDRTYVNKEHSLVTMRKSVQK